MLSTILAAPFIGSFLGVLIKRVPEHRPYLWVRSQCDACHHPLGALDLVPVASWALSAGRCRHCGVRVSVFYPVIELAALVVAIWAATVATGWRFILDCAFGWMLLVVATIEWRKRKRPWVPAAALAAWLGCLYIVFRTP